MSIRINNKDLDSTLDTLDETPHSTYHLASNPNLYEIQRKNNFEFIVTDLDGIKSVSGGQTFSNAQETLRISCKEASTPKMTQSAIEIKRGNNTIKYAGTPTYEDITIKFYDFIGTSAKDVLLAWQGKSYNSRTQKVGIATDYKKDCYLCEYSPDYQLVRKYKIHGAWVSTVNPGEYSADSNQVQEVSATIKYDYFDIEED